MVAKTPLTHGGALLHSRKGSFTLPKIGRRTTADGRKALKPGEYQRPNGGYQYKWREAGGYKSISAPTLEELREKEKAVMRDRLDGIKGGHTADTLNDWFARWKETKSIRDTTAGNYLYMYNHYISGGFGKRKIRDIKFHDVVSLYKSLGSRLATSTIDSIHNVLGQVFQVAVRADVIRSNPTAGAMREIKRATPKKKKPALTPEEQDRFLEVIRGTRWEAMFGIAIRTGLRCGELCALTWDDIDTEQRLIHIRRTILYKPDRLGDGHMRWYLNPPKTYTGIRDIPLTAELARLFELQRQIGFRCTQEIDGVSGFVFGSRNGGGCCYQNITNRAITRIIKRANEDKTALPLPDFTTHTLRHTYITNCARAGVPLQTVMAMVGHADMRTTVEIYTDIQPDMKEAAARMLDAYTAEHPSGDEE